MFFAPVLYGTIGGSIILSFITVKTFYTAMVVFATGPVIKLVFGYFCLSGRNIYNKKEKAVITSSLLAKATIQAVLAPQIKDFVEKNKLVSYT